MLSKYTDKALLACLCQSDLRAFDELYHRYAHQLMAFARMFFPNKETAEEAVQEIFIRIWENRESLDRDKDFKPYGP